MLLFCFVDSENIKSSYSSSSSSESDKVCHLPEPVVKQCKFKLDAVYIFEYTVLRLYNYFVGAGYP